MLKNFVDRGKYFLSLAKQGSQEWLDERQKIITASNFASASKLCEKYATQDDIIRMKNGEKQVFSEFSKKLMAYGSLHEDDARKIYQTQSGVKVEEIGLAIPKFNLNLGASVDGLVGDNGMIEIKCPQKIYNELLIHNYRLKHGKIFDKFYHEHISLTHYCQMQGCMAILDREWCDYVVYHESDIPKILISRIFFNEKFWKEDLYPGLLDCIKKWKVNF
jgi:putative phage-type endonuclease